MKKSRQTKRALIPSILAVIMCVAMLIGTTFAWFTDTASTSVNKVQAGTLKVDIVDTSESHNSLEGQKLNWVQAAGEGNGATTVTEDGKPLWEPGVTFRTTGFQIKSTGNLALKYKIALNGVDGSAELLKAITFSVVKAGTDGTYTAVDLDDFVGQLTATNSLSETLYIQGHMDETAGNDYQGESLEGIGITVYATQNMVEYDSTTNTYDDVDLWDGTIATDAELTEATSNQTITVSSAKLLAAVAQKVNSGTDYSGYTITLTKHLELCGIPWTPIGEKAGTAFKGTFDGGNKTIGGLNVTSSIVGNDGDSDKTDGKKDFDGFGALFGAIEGGTVKNLTVGGTVNCDNAAGIVARMNGGTVENCVSSVTVTGGRKAGGIVCAANSGTCTIKNCTNNGKVDLDATAATKFTGKKPVGGIVGYSNTCKVESCTNNGEIGSANVAFSGGIVGYATNQAATVTNSTNTGNVTGTANAAGIIGIVLNNNSATVKGCTNTGTIDAGSGTKGNLYTLNGNATVTTG